MNWIDLSGKIAVVTGAGGGIGRGIALALAEVGASLILLDRDERACRSVMNEVLSASGRAIAIACDVTLTESIAMAAERSLESVGPVDILVNNAGMQRPGNMDDLTLEDWQAVLSVNLTGYFLCAQAFGSQMLQKGFGSIIHVASISGHSPQGFSGAYSVSKSGIIMLSQQLATEWGPRGVRSNVISPGLIRTPMTKAFYDTPGVLEARCKLVPKRRIGEPQDIANAVVFLASDRADYITGEEITVDGGFTRTIMNVIPRPGFDLPDSLESREF
jgi:NAD(P)-dependent dehydrogenase (short-subunit alcohol dehydrogenase family)